MRDKLEKLGIDPESLLPERTRILREGSSPIAHGIDPSNAFWLSWRISRFRRLEKLPGMWPETRFWSQDKICRLCRLPRDEGSSPCTEPAEMLSCVRYINLPKAGVRVPESPGLPADCGPRKRELTLLDPSGAVMHSTPLKDLQGSMSAANSQVEKKQPPGKSAMEFFTDARTSKSCVCRRSCCCWARTWQQHTKRHTRRSRCINETTSLSATARPHRRLMKGGCSSIMMMMMMIRKTQDQSFLS